MAKRPESKAPKDWTERFKRTALKSPKPLNGMDQTSPSKKWGKAHKNCTLTFSVYTLPVVFLDHSTTTERERET